MELQKAQEARQAQRKADGSATTGATRPHERPVTASKMCIRDRGIGVVLMCILNVGKEADCEMKQLKESEDN